MSNQTTIKLNGEELVIKQSFRALMLFEKMAGKSVYKANEDLSDLMTLFYCIIKANNKNFKLNFDQFLDVVDENPEAFEMYNEFVASNVEPPTEDDKKKVENQ